MLLFSRIQFAELEARDAIKSPPQSPNNILPAGLSSCRRRRTIVVRDLPANEKLSVRSPKFQVRSRLVGAIISTARSLGWLFGRSASKRYDFLSHNHHDTMTAAAAASSASDRRTAHTSNNGNNYGVAFLSISAIIRSPADSLSRARIIQINCCNDEEIDDTESNQERRRISIVGRVQSHGLLIAAASAASLLARLVLC